MNYMDLLMFLFAFVMTIATVLLVRPIGQKIGLTDRPTHRKQHHKATPLVGGIAVYIVSQSFINIFDIFPLFQQPYFIASTLLLIVGVIDDYRGLGVKVRMLAQLLAGLIMIEQAGIKITHLGNLLLLGNINLEGFSNVFTIFAVVGGINAYNMVDGLDGLAGSLALQAMMAIGLIAWLAQDEMLMQFCLVVIAAIAGFLAFNLRIWGRKNGSIFLGDSGSTLLGFTVCWVAIYASQIHTQIVQPVSILWIMSIPLFDSVCIMVRRLYRGKSPFNPDREHLHHIMLLSGCTVNQIVARLFGIGILMALVALIADYIGVPAFIMFVGFIAIFIFHYVGMSQAWMMLKITRFIRSQKKTPLKMVAERRKKERRINQEMNGGNEYRNSVDRRNLIERRFIPNEQQLESFYKFEAMNEINSPKSLKDKIIIFWMQCYIYVK